MPILTDTEEQKLVNYARTLRRWRNSLDAWRTNIDDMLNEIGLEDEVLTVPRLSRRGVAPTKAPIVTEKPSLPATSAAPRRALVTRKVGRPKKYG